MTSIRSERLLRWAGPLLAMLVLLASLSGLWLRQSHQLQLLSIQSGSMAPLLNKGDAVVVWHVNPVDIQVGDIVSYASRQQADVIISHRVIAVDHGTGKLITAGDANDQADPDTNVAYIIGQVRYDIAGAGRLIDILHSWAGLSLLVYLPAALLITIEIRRLSRAYLRRIYRLPAYAARMR